MPSPPSMEGESGFNRAMFLCRVGGHGDNTLTFIRMGTDLSIAPIVIEWVLHVLWIICTSCGLALSIITSCMPSINFYNTVIQYKVHVNELAKYSKPLITFKGAHLIARLKVTGIYLVTAVNNV